ncbi:MAG: hypothetical protein AAB499_00220 [Patescibacteria group bacterium]
MDIIILPAAAPNWKDPFQPNGVAAKRCQAVLRKLLALPEARTVIIGGWPIRLDNRVVNLAEVMRSYLVKQDWRIESQIVLTDSSANCTVEDLNRLLERAEFASLVAEIEQLGQKPLIGFAGPRAQFFRAKRLLQASGLSRIIRVPTGEREVRGIRQYYWQMVANWTSLVDATWQGPRGREMVRRADDRYCRLVVERLGENALVHSVGSL